MKFIYKILIIKKILNLIIKFIFIIILLNILIIIKKNIKTFNGNLNYSILLNKLFNNKTIFFKKNKMNFLLYSKKTKIENAIMITKIIPFIKHNLLKLI